MSCTDMKSVDQVVIGVRKWSKPPATPLMH
jgi:hypothetical protein